MKRTKACVLAALTLAVAGGAVFAESLWVNSESVDIRQGKGAVYPTLGTATKGQELTVVSRDGKWVQVSAGGITGWVYEASTSAQKVNASGGGLFNVKPGTVAQVSSSAATKGLTPTAETYVSNKKLDKTPLEWLIKFRQGISAPEWEQFVNEGKVGPAAPQ